LSREQAYPFAHGKTGPELLIERLRGRNELTDAQREQLQRLSDGYRRERLKIDEAWIRSVDALVEAGDPSVVASTLQVPTYLAPRPGPAYEEVRDRERERDAMNREWARRVWEFAARSGLVEADARMPHHYELGSIQRNTMEESDPLGETAEEGR